MALGEIIRHREDKFEFKPHSGNETRPIRIGTMEMLRNQLVGDGTGLLVLLREKRLRVSWLIGIAAATWSRAPTLPGKHMHEMAPILRSCVHGRHHGWPRFGRLVNIYQLSSSAPWFKTDARLIKLSTCIRPIFGIYKSERSPSKCISQPLDIAEVE